MTDDHTAPRPGAVLLAPIPNPDGDGHVYRPGDPNACRLIAVAVAHPDEWPWRRLTGVASDVPSQWSDLSGWRRQSLAEVGEVLGT